MYNSFMYIIDNEGIDTLSAYPYQASVSTPLNTHTQLITYNRLSLYHFDTAPLTESF